MAISKVQFVVGDYVEVSPLFGHKDGWVGIVSKVLKNGVYVHNYMAATVTNPHPAEVRVKKSEMTIINKDAWLKVMNVFAVWAHLLMIQRLEIMDNAENMFLPQSVLDMIGWEYPDDCKSQMIPLDNEPDDDDEEETVQENRLALIVIANTLSIPTLGELLANELKRQGSGGFADASGELSEPIEPVKPVTTQGEPKNSDSAVEISVMGKLYVGINPWPNEIVCNIPESVELLGSQDAMIYSLKQHTIESAKASLICTLVQYVLKGGATPFAHRKLAQDADRVIKAVAWMYGDSSRKVLATWLDAAVEIVDKNKENIVRFFGACKVGKTATRSRQLSVFLDLKMGITDQEELTRKSGLLNGNGFNLVTMGGKDGSTAVAYTYPTAQMALRELSMMYVKGSVYGVVHSSVVFVRLDLGCSGGFLSSHY